MAQSPRAREGAPTRRALLQGGSALALPVPALAAAAAADPGLLVSRHFCALEAARDRLIYAWQDRESWLFKHRNWPYLSDDEQAAVPEGALLGEIDAQLDDLGRMQDALLSRLKRTSATTREGLYARFDALLLLVIQDEQPDARAMLKSCIRDVKRLWA